MADILQLKEYSALPGEPIVPLIERLELLLAKAKEGTLRAMAYTVVTTPPGAALPIITVNWYGPMHRDAIAHGMMLLQNAWLKAMDDISG